MFISSFLSYNLFKDISVLVSVVRPDTLAIYL